MKKRNKLPTHMFPIFWLPEETSEQLEQINDKRYEIR